MLIKNLLNGEKVKLTAFKESDFKSLEQWYGDSSFTRLFDMVSSFPKCEEELREMIKAIKDSKESYIFSIKEKETDKIIGITGFENIQWNNGTALVYIGIGDEECKGKGYGREAMKLLIDFAFDELNFHRLHLNVLQYNIYAIKLYEKLGFKKEGSLREFIHRDGKRFDLFYYGLLRSEWENGKV